MGVESSANTSVESGARSGDARAAAPAPGAARLAIRLLGPLELRCGGARVDLPASRKVRALLAYLALASRPVARSTLVPLLWDLPNDPRGELRGCLSKLRAVLDRGGRVRVLADSAGVRLDLSDVDVDVLEVLQATRPGLDALAEPDLERLQTQLAGEFLQDGDVERAAPFSAWLVAQRRRFRALELAALEHRARRLPPGSATRQSVIESWLERSPFDQEAHRALFDSLARQRRLQEGDDHLRRTMRLFDHEGQDWTALGRAWREARQRHLAPTSAQGQGDTAAPSDRGASAAPAVGSVMVLEGLPPAAAAPAAARASIVVMPFDELAGEPPAPGGLGRALAFDVTSRLAKLRSLFVIASGTSAALSERRIGAEDAGRRLQVDYVVSGTIQRRGGQQRVQVQLAELRSTRLLWADEISAPSGDTLAVLQQLGDSIVAALSLQVEQAERNRAILKAPSSLDAWEAHHRGLWHMYRFNPADNALAQRFFATAAHLDPTFARPYAGLSFTHFQNAFLEWHDREQETELAYRTAAQALLADEYDPLSHWAMGRALWLRGERQDRWLPELDTAVELSPSFAIGHYTRAFVQAQNGDPEAALAAADRSRALSPFDPMLFGILGSQAMALMRLGRYHESADAALKAASRPNAHVHIRALALHALCLAGRHEEAQAVAAAIQTEVSHYDVEAFFRAFRLDARTQALVREAAGRMRWN
jgi:DNA-binding SARP family transcriptional activator/TolB-like protein